MQLLWHLARPGQEAVHHLVGQLTEMPKAADAGELEERLADFLPWSDKVPESCRAGCRESVFEDEPVVDVDPALFDRD